MVANYSLQTRFRVVVSLSYMVLSRSDLMLFQQWWRDIGSVSIFKWVSPIDNKSYIARVVESDFNATARSPNSGKGLDGAFNIDLKIEYWE